MASARRYLGLIIPFFLAAGLVAGYWAYWSKAATTIETNVASAIGPTAASSIKVTGFPYRLTLEVRDLKYQAQNRAGFATTLLSATASPFNPMLWVLEGATNPTLALQGGLGTPLKATNLQASLRLRKDGFERFSLTFDGLNAQGEGGWSVGKGLLHLITDPMDETTLAFVAEAQDIFLSKPLDGPGAILGQKVQRFRLAGPIVEGQALLKSPSQWQAKNGVFNVMAGEIQWGPVGLSAVAGQLSQSATGKWQGSLRGQGALKPEGIAVAGLSAPVTINIAENKASLEGLPSLDLRDVLQLK